MKEITIKTHTRKSKNGKVVKVSSYSRRVGRKGVISPKRSKKEAGKEFEEKAQQKYQQEENEMGPYFETTKQREERYERLKSGKSAVYSRNRLQEVSQQDNHNVTTPTRAKNSSWKQQMSFMERVEDKVASFVEKYSKKKYKRQV